MDGWWEATLTRAPKRANAFGGDFRQVKRGEGDGRRGEAGQRGLATRAPRPKARRRSPSSPGSAIASADGESEQPGAKAAKTLAALAKGELPKEIAKVEQPFASTTSPTGARHGA